MEGGGMAETDELEPVDPFDTGRHGESDGREAEAVEPPVEVQAEAPLLADEGDEVPPEPEDAVPVPLAERERRKLAAMTPEQRVRYDEATGEIMSHPAVAAFAAEEDRARAAKKANQEAFLAAYRKKLKEKS
jgi:hypothetical protein